MNEVFIYCKDFLLFIVFIGFVWDVNEFRGFISACAWRSDEFVFVVVNLNGVVKVLCV